MACGCCRPPVSHAWHLFFSQPTKIAAADGTVWHECGVLRWEVASLSLITSELQTFLHRSRKGSRSGSGRRTSRNFSGGLCTPLCLLEWKKEGIPPLNLELKPSELSVFICALCSISEGNPHAFYSFFWHVSNVTIFCATRKAAEHRPCWPFYSSYQAHILRESDICQLDNKNCIQCCQSGNE